MGPERKEGRKEGGKEYSDSRVEIEAGREGDQCHSDAKDTPISFSTLARSLGVASGQALRDSGMAETQKARARARLSLDRSFIKTRGISAMESPRQSMARSFVQNHSEYV